MEFCEGGDLGAIIKKAKVDRIPVKEEFIWRVLAQITIALKECHRHKDSASSTPKLKPILVSFCFVSTRMYAVSRV